MLELSIIYQIKNSRVKFNFLIMVQILSFRYKYSNINPQLLSTILFFQNEGMFVQLDELGQLDRLEFSIK